MWLNRNCAIAKSSHLGGRRGNSVAARCRLPDHGGRMTTDAFTPTGPTTFKRKPERGTYDREVAYAILDEGFVAHVGVAVDGRPFVIPMTYARDGDRLLLHGSVASRLLRALDDGVATCVTVTLVDGVVLAEAQRSHSLNYRCVVVMGTARRVHEPEASGRALRAIVEHLAPGRTAEAREATEQEQRETLVVELPIEVASVKQRSGGPVPDELRSADDAPRWSGVLPLSLVAGAPVPDPASASLPLPPSVRAWSRVSGAR
jgi:nitroimidazol reductase NimA-like FMN-containing flavoprotein (pyridoxamine 5'-phosphate oxidase superfamily)